LTQQVPPSGLQQPSARAIKLKAELSGQYVQRKEDVNNKHLATDWSTDELVAFIAGVEASVRGSEKTDSPALIIDARIAALPSRP
jgi:hypothetical protein